MVAQRKEERKEHMKEAPGGISKEEIPGKRNLGGLGETRPQKVYREKRQDWETEDEWTERVQREKKTEFESNVE